jgi:hypothetical protein
MGRGWCFGGDFARVRRGFLVRHASQVLPDCVAKKPDSIIASGFLALRGWNKAHGLQRNLFPDDIVLHLAKVQPN